MSDRDNAEMAAEQAPAEETVAGDPPAGETPDAGDGDVADAVAPESRNASLNLVRGLVVLVVFLAGLALWPIAARYLPASWSGRGGLESRLDARLAPLDARIARLEAKLAKLAGRESVDLAPLRDALAAERKARGDGLARLQRRLDDLDKRLQALPAEASPSAEALTALDARMEGVEGELATLRGRVEETGHLAAAIGTANDQLGALEARLSALERKAAEAGASGRRYGLVLAVGQLAAAVDAGRAFRDALDRLSGLGGDDAEIAAALAALAPHADRGVATLAALRRRFQPLAGAIVRAGAAPAADGWLAQAARRLESLVTVRRTGEVAGTATDAVVARAEVRLQEGDLAGALAELKGLDGAAADAAASWRQAAQARLDAEAAVKRLQARAIAMLGQA